MTLFFRNRYDAGIALAKELLLYKKEQPVLLALPRGGVLVAYAVAKELEIPLQVLVARKIGAPGNPEFGIGAISENNSIVLDTEAIAALDYAAEDVAEIKEEEKKELQRRIERYRNNQPLPDMHNKTVIIVDDGLATGVTALAAIQAVQKENPKKIIVAIPVCSTESTHLVTTKVDKLICLISQKHIQAIGQYYKDFHQVSDEEVMEILQER